MLLAFATSGFIVFKFLQNETWWWALLGLIGIPIVYFLVGEFWSKYGLHQK